MRPLRLDVHVASSDAALDIGDVFPYSLKSSQAPCIKKRLTFYSCINMYVCKPVCMGDSGYKPPNMDAGNQTPVLCKNSKCALLLNHLSSHLLSHDFYLINFK